VDYLKLETEPDPHSYTIDWIKKGPSIKVTDICHILFQLASIIKIPLPVMLSIWTHIIYFWGDHGNMMLMQSTRVERTSTWKDKRVSMRPAPPIPKSTKEKEPKLINTQSRHIKILGSHFSSVEFTKYGIVNSSIDQNSRTSSFKG